MIPIRLSTPTSRWRRIVALSPLLLMAGMAGCLPASTRSGSGGSSYPEARGLPALEVDQGEASFYADQFEGRQTASGERFTQTEYTAAHRTYPFGTLVRIINLRNGRMVIVKVNDRGPFKQSRLIDLTRRAAEDLAMTRDGTATVRLEVVRWGDRLPD